MAEKNGRAVLMRWAAFSFAPLIICLLTLVGSIHEGVKSYGSCIERNQHSLPPAIVGTCCVIHDRFESRVITNQDRLLIPYSDVIRVLWNRMHSLSAVMFCLFLTPNLLYFFSLWLRSARGVLIRLAEITSTSAYALIAISLIYALATFKDS